MIGMKRLVIFDKNEEYARELAEYLNESVGKKSHRERFSVHLFTEVSALLEYCGKQQTDILLLSEPVSEEEQKQFEMVQAKKKLFLTEVNLEEEGKVYKYQSAEKILRIVTDTRREEKEFLKKKEENQIYGVYAPTGRCGKTSFALALAKQLSEQDSALFLSMDTFSGLKKVLPNQTGMDLSDLMYFALQGREEIYRQCKKCINEMEGMQYILPASGANVFSELDQKQWETLFLNLIDASKNQYLVIDFGTGIEKIWEMLSVCDCILMPCLEDEDGKVMEFEEFLLQSGREELYDRILKIHVPKESCLGMVELRQIFWGELKSMAQYYLMGNGCKSGA